MWLVYTPWPCVYFTWSSFAIIRISFNVIRKFWVNCLLLNFIVITILNCWELALNFSIIAVDNVSFQIFQKVGQIISKNSILQEIWSHPFRGAVNIHPSLLPRWRGAAPLFHTILADDNITGVSLAELSGRG